VLQIAVACVVLAAVSASEEEDLLGLPEEKDGSREVFKRATPPGKRFIAVQHSVLRFWTSSIDLYSKELIEVISF
jgi:hypothetical protein